MSGSGLTFLMDELNNFIETKSDPRTSKWLLMSSPAPLLTIVATYLYFCMYAGPKYMKDRKPFDLKNTIILYNLVQVFLSVFLVYEGVMGGWFTGYSFTCQPVDWSDDPKAVRMAAAVWWYFFCKITELLDTVFFVLRKKNNQISFLHLYHHSMMPVCAWVGTRFLPGGHGTLLGIINSFIHIIMYGYYFVASLGPQYQKYLWWKKHLTSMQMVIQNIILTCSFKNTIQFCIIFVHNMQNLFRECNYPKVITFLLGTQAFFFFCLFGNFYYNSYVKTRPATEKKPLGNTAVNGTANGSTVKEINANHLNGKIANGILKKEI
ncbi:uncharacterized protein CBL_09906 [Carabus blaptoides fortunei]